MDPFPPAPPAYRDRRPDALGDLQVLPDETLCAILELLSPVDLGRLSCVSSVLYILCNEEPLWMSQCLKDGGLLDYKDSWKRTTLHRQNLCIMNEGALRKALQFDGFNSLFLYRRWYRCFTTLSIFSLDNGDIERKSSLTLEDFHSDYDSKKPVLLTELASTWPARTKWSSVEQLSLYYGNVSFRISQRSSKKITMKLKNYVSYMKLQHDEDPLYIFDDKFGETAPSLLEDYMVPHIFQEDFFDVLDPDKRPSYRWIIIGPERSGASWHVDPALTSAWNTLLCGRKRWALYPPGRVPPGVIVHVNEEDGDVNIESPTSLQWWLDIYPHLAEEHKPIECTQLPGETIYVPSGWWHFVLNLETTIAVTQNFVNTSNFHFVCLDMAPGHRHKGVCRAGLLAVQDSGFSSVEESDLFDGNSLNETDNFPKKKRQKGIVSEGDLFKCNGDSHARDASFPIQSKTQKGSFLYDIEFLSSFLEEERDHYNSLWSPSNCIGQREIREWFHKLWMTKPTIRQLVWKGADLALNVNKWYECMMEICMRHSLPSPSDDEKLPVGTGSNPVYLVSDYVVKLYVEEGLGTSIHGLGTELQFYDIIHNVKSPLLDHVPDVIASGILFKESGSLQIIPWDGKGVPEVIANCKLLSGDHGEQLFPFGVWSKKIFELNRVVSNTNIWPYIIIKRCKGDIFANLRDKFSNNDVLELASFLGEQLRNLHLLPLPQTQSINHLDLKKHSLADSVDDSCESSKAPVIIASKDIKIPLVWKPIVASLDRKRQNIKKQLSTWGDPIPLHLIEEVDNYIPNEVAMLLDLEKDGDGFNKISGSPTWLHSDIMDDNIHVESYSSNCLDPSFAHPTTNSCADDLNGEMSGRKWQPTHIIDFSGLSVGHPLYDLIPIYLDVFRGDMFLLKHFLKSYRLPLAKGTTYGEQSCGMVENVEKFKRISYRAMCYCILNDENILGAIFSLWKELRTAKSWEQVEEAVWGPLNDDEYQCS